MSKIITINISGLSATERTKWQKVYFPMVRTLNRNYSDPNHADYIEEPANITPAHIAEYFEVYSKNKAKQFFMHENELEFNANYTDLKTET